VRRPDWPPMRKQKLRPAWQPTRFAEAAHGRQGPTQSGRSWREILEGGGGGSASRLYRKHIPDGGFPPNEGKRALWGGKLSESRMALISRKVTDGHGAGVRVLFRNTSPIPHHRSLPIPYPCTSLSSVIQTAQARAELAFGGPRGHTPYLSLSSVIQTARARAELAFGGPRGHTPYLSLSFVIQTARARAELAFGGPRGHTPYLSLSSVIQTAQARAELAFGGPRGHTPYLSVSFVIQTARAKTAQSVFHPGLGYWRPGAAGGRTCGCDIVRRSIH
jgi:hypothetical protein